MTDEEWDDALSSHLCVSPSINNRLIQLYMFHQSYLTPIRLAKMGRRPDSSCHRCGHPDTDFMHMMWSCHYIASFWSEVIQFLNSLTRRPVPMLPRHCLLGLFDEELWSPAEIIFLREVLFLARKAIALRWMDSRTPTVAGWKALVNTSVNYEYLVYKHRKKPQSEVYGETNQTVVTEFFLLGFQVSRGLRLFLFCLFLVVYCLTICGNLLIITLVSTSKNLHTPMYFFISHLSISDILVSTDIVPNLLHILLNNGGTMTFIGCMTQFYFFCASETFECLLLTVMSYDRYVAICNPLRYSSIVTHGICMKLAAMCWLLGIAISSIISTTPLKLIFCGSNIIDHVFCDILPLLGLVCSDAFIVQLEIYVLGIPSVIIPTTIIVGSYTYIVLTILRIPSNSGRQKAFSTCSSHLIVVSIFYGTIFSVYIVQTKGQTLTMSKILSLLYTVFTPLVNPIIYSLRNKDIKKAVHHFIKH
ncbi:olfactory receptor 1009-like [Hyla sarda]|uniref:olfactory receptor 1009-like n=1 Tax=Hyla sarda TaxID=327740 RepID=UPI0024C2B463|nr:olfactory receptor 1009-like [Hyla sarda]